jgi:hypothetical protein
MPESIVGVEINLILPKTEQNIAMAYLCDCETEIMVDYVPLCQN